jgi:hypothetical protein
VFEEMNMIFGPVPPSPGTLPQKLALFIMLTVGGFVLSSISSRSKGKVREIIIFLVGALIILGAVVAFHFF